MSIIDRISGVGRTTLPEPKAAAVALDTAEQRLVQITDEIPQAEADVQAAQLRRQTADATVIRLTEQAAAGTLDDPTRLTAALRRQRELAGESQAVAINRLNALRAERERLQQEIHTRRSNAAAEAYSDACQAYARACTRLPTLELRIRETAEAAGVLLLDEDAGPRIVGRAVHIGGAVIDIPVEG